MDREDQLIGEIVAARSTAQMLCYVLVQSGIIARETIEDRLTVSVAYWTKQAKEGDEKRKAWATVAAVRLTEFLKEFREELGGIVQ